MILQWVYTQLIFCDEYDKIPHKMHQLVDTTWITTWQRTSWNLPKTKRTMDEFVEVRFPRKRMGEHVVSLLDFCFLFVESDGVFEPIRT